MVTQKYIRSRKPLIEAFQFDGTVTCFDDIVAWLLSSSESYAVLGEHRFYSPVFLFKTAAGYVPLVTGDWIVRDNENVFRKMDNETFGKFWEETP